MRRFFTLQLRRSYLRFGEVWLSGRPGGLSAAAFWLPPTALVPRPGDTLWPLLLIGVFGARLAPARRLGQLLAARHPRAPHWYLGTVGVDPARQGRGLGTALLAAALRRCDEAASAAYLECSREDNVAFYARLGFETMEEVHVPEGPVLWPMWRPPRPLDAGFGPLRAQT